MKKSVLLSSLVLLTQLQGCAGVIVAGAATTAVVVNDRRSLGALIDDKGIELKAKSQLAASQTLADSRIFAISTNGKVLLIGQTPTQSARAKAQELISRIPGVRHVYNELRLGNPIGVGEQSSDAWLSTKINSRMLAEKNFDSTRIKVNTENGEVFLMGLVTRDEGDRAVTIVRHISGVKKVIRVFEYVQAPGKPAPKPTSSSANTPASSQVDGDVVQMGSAAEEVIQF